MGVGAHVCSKKPARFVYAVRQLTPLLHSKFTMHNPTQPSSTPSQVPVGEGHHPQHEGGEGSVGNVGGVRGGQGGIEVLAHARNVGVRHAAGWVDGGER